MKNKDSIKKPESVELHKGYNEKNPTEAEGAFKPDNETEEKEEQEASSPIVEKDKTEKANQ